MPYCITDCNAICYHTIQSYVHNQITNVHIIEMEMGVKLVASFSHWAKQKKEIVTGLAVVYFVISTLPLCTIFLFFAPTQSPLLFSLTTHTLFLSLSVWTMPLWQEPRIADDVTQELCGSPDCSHSRKACWDKQSLRGKKWQSFTSWCNYSSIMLRNYCEWEGQGRIIEWHVRRSMNVYQ